MITVSVYCSTKSFERKPSRLNRQVQFPALGCVKPRLHPVCCAANNGWANGCTNCDINSYRRSLSASANFNTTLLTLC